MKIQYCSDLHLEFPDNKKFIQRHPITVAADILILAGDIVPFTEIERHADFFDQLSSDFKTVYWIPGNHEYYHSDIALRQGSFCEAIRENVFLLNNTVIEINDRRLLFSTLWSSISPVNHLTVQRSIADFHQVHYNGTLFNPDHFNSLHEGCKAFIKTALPANGDHSRTMVVTHHVPTFLHYPPQYLKSPVNEVFAVELADLIHDAGAAYWLYGHHHCNVPSFTVGQTALITNQLGYVNKREHRTYLNPAIIDL